LKLKALKKTFHNQLDAIYGKEEVSSFFFMLTESYFNFGRMQLALEPNFTISEEEEQQLQNALKDLKTQKPIQYILGETEFYGLPFKVNSNVLIPRPETEELVSLVLQNSKNKIPNSNDCPSEQSQFRILDIGTGSGCIAIALAKNLPPETSGAKVYALDVSTEALKIAKKNAKLNNVEVEFINADILEFEAGSLKHEVGSLKAEINQNSFPFKGKVSRNFGIDLKESEDGKVEEKFFPFGKDVALRQKGFFDIIVSNPPYVREQEKEKMKPNVLQNEPHLALFVEDNDALQFYKAITKFAVHNLSKNGMLFFEINEYLGQQMIELLENSGFENIELKQDIFGRDRMVKGVKI
jgi:release factor glutamine methyltransferase